MKQTQLQGVEDTLKASATQRRKIEADVDALKIVSEGVNRARATGEVGVLLITHYTRILRYIRPDFVHVFVDGRIVAEGGAELADQLEAGGYDEYVKAAAGA